MVAVIDCLTHEGFLNNKDTVLGKRIKETPCSMQQKSIETSLRKAIRMRFEVLAAVCTKPTVFQDFKLCNLVGRCCATILGICCLHLQNGRMMSDLKMKAADFSKCWYLSTKPHSYSGHNKINFKTI
jgi:hypothetical protein